MKRIPKVEIPRCICIGLAALAVLARAQQTPPPSPAGAEAAVSVQAPPSTSPSSGKATLYVYRHRRYEGAALRPSVYLDEKEVARMDNGRFFTVKLDPGKHSVRSNDKASGVDLDVKVGADYYIRVDMQTGFWKGHGRLTFIMPEQGAYEVKQTKPLNDGDVRDRELVVAGSQP